jgi:hypothetical protein
VSPEQWHGVKVCAGLLLVGGFTVIVGAALLLQTNRAITRLQRERDAYRADRQRRRDEVTLARALGAPWHDVYGGDDA